MILQAVCGTSEKNSLAPGTNQIAIFDEFHALSHLEKDEKGFRLRKLRVRCLWDDCGSLIRIQIFPKERTVSKLLNLLKTNIPKKWISLCIDREPMT